MGIFNSKKKNRKREMNKEFFEKQFYDEKDRYDDDSEDAVNLIMTLKEWESEVNVKNFSVSWNYDLSITCENLPNGDRFSKSDPMVVVFKIDEAEGKKELIGMTEFIQDELNPRFTK